LAVAVELAGPAIELALERSFEQKLLIVGSQNCSAAVSAAASAVVAIVAVVEPTY